MTSHDTWFRCAEPRPAAALRLVCFPHAGGAASFYGSWSRSLPSSVELLAVQYPGREDRIRDDRVHDMGKLADLVAEALEPLCAGRPISLLGHSMGAGVAYEVACRLERRGRTPARLFVSGRPAPDRQRRKAVHRASDEDLLTELRRLAPANHALADHPELAELMLPTVRDDFRLIESYEPCGSVLDCPVTAMLGDHDTEVTVEEAQGWRAFTRGRFTMKVFPGDHFYLIPRRAQLIDWVLRSLDGVAAPPRAWPSTP
ncbi:thioesterase II family protein [Actinomadura sp. SCN-SB]|uniref:thioesterase II family protein n=1 Tax=Actinomadura sp. SCN-SB TaxID=3373092 RepID=UPI003752264C